MTLLWATLWPSSIHPQGQRDMPTQNADLDYALAAQDKQIL
jgi:hypothetical protein